ncbi:MAG TPA: hypothetical protein VK395_09120 [Gemmataceae bacterium]|nr:hypothetical protein [Gemmataceae bacterium]
MSYSTYFAATLATMIFGTAVADDNEATASPSTLDEALKKTDKWCQSPCRGCGTHRA